MTAMKAVLVIIFTLCIEKSQQERAQKCHGSGFFGTNLEHCPSDLIEARCEDGLIEIWRVIHEDDNCNVGCGSTCCIKSVDEEASYAVTQKVKSECNGQESCRLTSFTFGTAYVDYTCIEITTTTSFSSTSSSTNSVSSTRSATKIMTTTSVNSNSNPDKSVSSTEPETSMVTESSTLITEIMTTTSVNSISSSSIQSETSTITESSTLITMSSTGSETSNPSGTQMFSTTSSTDSQTFMPFVTHTDSAKIQTEVLIAIPISVGACLAAAAVTVILCRRHRTREQKRIRDIQMDAYPETSYSAPNNIDDNEYNEFPGPEVDTNVERSDEYNTTTELHGNISGATDNDYDHVTHHKGKPAASESSPDDNSGGNQDHVYDSTQNAFQGVITDVTYDHVGGSVARSTDNGELDDGDAAADAGGGEYDVCDGISERRTTADNTYGYLGGSGARSTDNREIEDGDSAADAGGGEYDVCDMISERRTTADNTYETATDDLSTRGDAMTESTNNIYTNLGNV